MIDSCLRTVYDTSGYKMDLDFNFFNTTSINNYLEQQQPWIKFLLQCTVVLYAGLMTPPLFEYYYNVLIQLPNGKIKNLKIPKQEWEQMNM